MWTNVKIQAIRRRMIKLSRSFQSTCSRAPVIKLQPEKCYVRKGALRNYRGQYTRFMYVAIAFDQVFQLFKQNFADIFTMPIRVLTSYNKFSLIALITCFGCGCGFASHIVAGHEWKRRMSRIGCSRQSIRAYSQIVLKIPTLSCLGSLNSQCIRCHLAEKSLQALIDI